MAAGPTKTTRLGRGTKLGKYRLLSRLGEGGFSEVWKAKDLIEDRWVALKLPTPVRAQSDDEEELLREIRLSASLVHPAILGVRNADRINDRFVIATDLARESLEDRLGRRLGVRLALGYMHQILQGLSHAHEHRIIHRDLKPSNLMIFDDRIKIADFGLAKVAKHTMISATGSGTLLYVAPEQAHGYPCFASDVFSVGLIFHQMLAGALPRWPFRWPFMNNALLRAKATPACVDMIRKATDPDHRMRYRDATVMLEELEAILPAMERFADRRASARRRALRLHSGRGRKAARRAVGRHRR